MTEEEKYRYQIVIDIDKAVEQRKVSKNQVIAEIIEVTELGTSMSFNYEAGGIHSMVVMRYFEFRDHPDSTSSLRPTDPRVTCCFVVMEDAPDNDQK